jgi:kynureninase
VTTPTDEATTRAYAEQLDRDDPLASYRDEFVIPDDAVIYLDGNSLGRLPKATQARVKEVLDEDWGAQLIRSWEDRWMHLPGQIGDLIGTGLLGAGPGEVIVGDSTTVALYKAMSALLDAQPDRRAIVIERDNFPTDRYLVESLAGRRELEVRWIEEAGPDGLQTADVTSLLDDDVAFLVLSQVDYRSAAITDLAGITAAAHDAGVLTLWDLCHSVGSIPIDVHRDGVDVAVGCTYKYLNGGPGSPSFTYVRADLQPRLSQPIWGWWGRTDMFDMAQGYQPQADVRSWLSGTPSMLSLCAVEPSVQLVVDAGIDVGAADGTGRLAARRVARPAGSRPRQPARPGATGFARDRDAPECKACGNCPDSPGRSSGFSSSRRNPSGNGPLYDEIRRRS